MLNSVELTASALQSDHLGLAYKLLGRISHIPSVKFKPVCIMDDAIHAGICIGTILKYFIPTTNKELWDHHGRTVAVSAFYYFKEISTFINVKFHEAEVIDHQKIKCWYLLCAAQILTGNLCLLQFIDQGARFYILDRVELSECTYAQCIGNICFPWACASGNKKVSSFLDPATLGKPFDGSCIKKSAGIRNVAISKILYLNKLIGQFGSGFKRINSLCKDAGIKYSYEFSDNEGL